MAYLNKVMLIGNVGREPEVMTFQSGAKAVNFSLATSKRYRDNKGEQKEQTDWHNIKAIGKTAETIEKLHVTKGSSLYVEGELQQRNWTDQTSGQRRTVTEVLLLNFQLLGGKAPQPRNDGDMFGNGSMGPDQEDDLPF